MLQQGEPFVFQRRKVSGPSEDVQLIFVGVMRVHAVQPFTPDDVGGEKWICLAEKDKIDPGHHEALLQVDGEGHLLPNRYLE